jgi:hypothetical protein
VLIARPSEVWREYVRSTGRIEGFSWEMGRMAMALEIITQIKILEEIKVMGDTARAQAVTALQTLLQDCGMGETAWQIYEDLDKWRRVRFYAEPAPEHEGTVVSAADVSARRLGRRIGTVSARASLGEGSAHPNTPRALPRGHRDPGGPPIDGPVG